MRHSPRKRGESWEAYADRTHPDNPKRAKGTRTPKAKTRPDNTSKLLQLAAKTQPSGHREGDRPQTAAMQEALKRLSTAPSESPDQYVTFDVRAKEGHKAVYEEEHGRGQRSAVKGKKLHIRRAHRTWVHGVLLGK